MVWFGGARVDSSGSGMQSLSSWASGLGTLSLTCLSRLTRNAPTTQCARLQVWFRGSERFNGLGL